MKNKKKFRRCQATEHRNKAVIVFENGNYAEGFVLTHNPGRLKDTYHELMKNPDPNDKQKSFIVHRLRKGKIGKGELFSEEELHGLLLCAKDDKDIDLLYKAKKENKPWDYYIKKAASNGEINNDTLMAKRPCTNIKTNKVKKRNKKR